MKYRVGFFFVKVEIVMVKNLEGGVNSKFG